jgi:hypothetical protein
MPAPKGSKIRPALTEAQAQSISDDELERLGYPGRPDAVAEPDRYAKWLDHVSRPMTVLPTHLLRTNVTARPKPESFANWSGLEAHSKTFHNYSAVDADWSVPQILGASSDGNPDYSAFWIGLDRLGLGTTRPKWQPRQLPHYRLHSGSGSAIRYGTGRYEVQRDRSGVDHGATNCWWVASRARRILPDVDDKRIRAECHNQQMETRGHNGQSKHQHVERQGRAFDRDLVWPWQHIDRFHVAQFPVRLLYLDRLGVASAPSLSLPLVERQGGVI